MTTTISQSEAHSRYTAGNNEGLGYAPYSDVAGEDTVDAAVEAAEADGWTIVHARTNSEEVAVLENADGELMAIGGDAMGRGAWAVDITADRSDEEDEGDETDDTIEIVMESPNGPKVYLGRDAEKSDAEEQLEAGWSVDWDSCVDLGDGRQSFPLVRTVLAETKDGVEILLGEWLVIEGKGSDPRSRWEDTDIGEVQIGKNGQPVVNWHDSNVVQDLVKDVIPTTQPLSVFGTKRAAQEYHDSFRPETQDEV